jgi:hypothetical protein
MPRPLLRRMHLLPQVPLPMQLPAQHLLRSRNKPRI